MAPILTEPTGIPLQEWDDPALQALYDHVSRLADLDGHGTAMPQAIAPLAHLLQPWNDRNWLCDEPVDLHGWIHLLNVMDSALAWVVEHHSQHILLIPPPRSSTSSSPTTDQCVLTAATSLADLEAFPAELEQQLLTILQFTALLLRNSLSKSIYQSVGPLTELLAAAKDEIADAALAALQALAIPAPLHRQQAPDQQHQQQHHSGHISQLHRPYSSMYTMAANASSSAASATPPYSDPHVRLTATARGWGTRAMGLGLWTAITADDSVYGQGNLPLAAGELSFSYYAPHNFNENDSKEMEMAPTSPEAASLDDNDKQFSVPSLIDSNAVTRITLLEVDMMVVKSGSASEDFASSPITGSSSDASMADPQAGSGYENADGTMDPSSTKRRRVTAKRQVKTAAELFFLALERAGPEHQMSNDVLFSLLADIRLARSFHCQATRIAAVERRLRALIAILNAHPSQEVISGYFQAQPELCVEIVDLLRPIVSAANISLNTASNTASSSLEAIRHDPISNLVGGGSTSAIPFSTRVLALEALSALISRREGSSSTMSASARLSTTLNELGVGKGQYLGFLPTLIRYSLASLGSATLLPSTSSKPASLAREGGQEAVASLDQSSASLEAIIPPPIPRIIEVQRALEFIDNVLTLTSSVVANPSGTSALVDCGLIPALLSTVSMDPARVVESLLCTSRRVDEGLVATDDRRIRAMLRFVTAQAIQIIEGAIVTHNNALTTFLDLQGVEIFITRLSRELGITTNTSTDSDKMEVEPSIETDRTVIKKSKIEPAQRVLLYCILTCLTVVFHQDTSSPSATPSPSGAAQLRSKSLTDAFIAILDDICLFGGHLASLIATLLSDVMNSEPHVVHHVHSSGIARAFLAIIMGSMKTEDGTSSLVNEPLIPPVPEFIMSIPSVISALSLTDDGAKVVQEANPFPALLRIFYHPKYAMPRSRCLLSEMTAIVGTGLDEIMRHVDRLKPLVLSAVADAIKAVVALAEDLSQRESVLFGSLSLADSEERAKLETDRSCLILYVLNVGQLLEQVLHSEEHCEPFVSERGLDALLRVFPATLPGGLQVLAHFSGLSSPSVSTLHHSTIEETISLVFKCFEYRYDYKRILQKIISTATALLNNLEESHHALFTDQSLYFALDQVPLEPLYKLPQPECLGQLRALSNYLRNVASVQWITSLLGTAIRAACQRSTESGTGWSRDDREWKKEIGTDEFRDVIEKLSALSHASLFEVSRLRTLKEFEEREERRLATRERRLRFRLRIVCPEGAVVRDGIDIDSCANVGSMEMGEIVESYDRCINSSGILRYRTKRGWVSEMTRGHGREPIAEVLHLWIADKNDESLENNEDGSDRRMEAGILDLQGVTVGILARGQIFFSELFGSLSKLVTQGIRSIPARIVSFDDGTPSKHVADVMKLVCSFLKNGLNQEQIKNAVGCFSGMTARSTGPSISWAGASVYIGCMMSHLQACLFDDKRDRKAVNFPLLIRLVATDSFVDRQGLADAPKSDVERTEWSVGVFDALRFVFNHCLSDFAERADSPIIGADDSRPRQRVARSVAASLPPLISILRRMMSSHLSLSPAASIMSRMKWKDVACLLGEESLELPISDASDSDAFFKPEGLVRCLQLAVSKVAREFWADPRFVSTPPYLLHPTVCLVGDLLIALEESSKKKTVADASNPRSGERVLLSDLLRRRQDESGDLMNNDDYEPSEEAITQLLEMGFSRDHAIDALESTRSSRIELAMDYVLSNPPPSMATIERRRAAREERARRRAEQQQQASQNVDHAAVQADSETTTNNDSDAFIGAVDAERMDVDSGRVSGTASATVGDIPRESGPGRTKSEHQAWLMEIPMVCCSIFDHLKPPNTALMVDDSSGQHPSIQFGDAEAEALTVVISSFLLDLCHRYPNNRAGIVTLLLKQVNGKLNRCLLSWNESDPSSHREEGSISALLHAVVLFVRALPKTRILVLQEGIVRSLVSCIEAFLSCQSTRADMRYALWMPSAFLLLDMMAQPSVFFSGTTAEVEEEPGLESELFLVREEHKSQMAELASIAEKLFAWTKHSGPDSTNGGCDKQADEKEGDESDMKIDKPGESDNAKQSSALNPFSSIPAYFPLLSLDCSRRCLDICLGLLSRDRKVDLPPGLAHSVLLLLLRLLRSPKASSKCLQFGVAEDILNLPNASKFTGNTGLVTLIFRRLLEDESALQSAMETEMKSALFKLHAKTNTSVSDGSPNALLSSFVEAVTPLLCRDPLSFLKAMFLSVKIQIEGDDRSQLRVVLLAPKERNSHADALREIFKGLQVATPTLPRHEDRRSDDIRLRRLSSPGKPRGKCTPKSIKRASFSKKVKKERLENSRGSAHNSFDSAASHVTFLLLNSLLATESADLHDDKSFLWVGNLLEILADLILAVPACASAVHNYRVPRTKEKGKQQIFAIPLRHGLSNSPNPSKNFVNFLLHYLLPQDRWTLRNDTQIWDRRKDDAKEEADTLKQKKAKAYRILKLSQASARVLGALAGRPGEGRRRVIGELALALSGGQIVYGKFVPISKRESTFDGQGKELHALQAWGELCLGFAAPRSNGKNLEGISCLSIENLRLMLDLGMAHALLYAMHRVKLFHPMSSVTCGALLQPLEVLTRAAVGDAVKDLVAKDATTKDYQNSCLGEFAPVADGECNGQQSVAHEPGDMARGSFNENEGVHHGNDQLVDFDMLVDGHSRDNADDDDDAEMEEVVDDQSDGGMHSSESDESSQDDELGTETEEEEEDSDDSEDSEEVPSDDAEEEVAWDDYNPALVAEHLGDGQEFGYDEVGEEDGTEQVDHDVDEGWTRIESSGFGGMLLGGRRQIFAGAGESAARSRGFIDATEAMIGTILRNGDMTGDALAEIEGSLGIRIMAGSRPLFAALRPVEGGLLGEAIGVRALSAERGGVDRMEAGEALGALPHIHQRSQPDIGYSSPGRNALWVEANSMEFVFGGPSVTSGSRNYDLITPMRYYIESSAPNFSQLDLQLFPGGPAASAAARTQHSLHPLLCGVDLPPMNSLVSDLLPHGIRSTRRGQMTTRRPGDWTNASFAPGSYLVSTSNGNIMRSHRAHAGTPMAAGLASRNPAAPVGWTDDGMPVDGAVEEFRAAVEQALREAATTQQRNASARDAVPDPLNTVEDNGASPGNPDAAPSPTQHTGSHAANENMNVSIDINPPNTEAGHSSNEQNDIEQESVRSEGERAASSLAAALRLSPRSETSAEHIASEQTGVGERVAALEHAEATYPSSDIAELVDPSSLAGPERRDTDGVSLLLGRSDHDGSNEETEVHNGKLACPPDIDPEVFQSLPRDMQQDCVDQYNATRELAAQLDGSSLDPDVLAALPEDVRREVIEQDRRERGLRDREDPPADPAQAEEMDNANFIASLSPELREEILLTADDTFLSSLPPNIVAEAQILRERASSQSRRMYEDAITGDSHRDMANGENSAAGSGQRGGPPDQSGNPSGGARRKQRYGKLKVDCDRSNVLYTPETLCDPISKADIKAFFRLMFLISPVRPARLLQRMLQNLLVNPTLRNIMATVFIKLLQEDGKGSLEAIESWESNYPDNDTWRKALDLCYSDPIEFPPSGLIGTAPEMPSAEACSLTFSASLLRISLSVGAAASAAANLTRSSGGKHPGSALPPVVAARLLDALMQICKNSPRFSLHVLVTPLIEGKSAEAGATCFESLLELLERPMYSRSAANLEQLLTLLESAVSPLSQVPKHEEEELELPQRDIEAAASSGKEWVDVPRITVSQGRLKLLCSTLRMEACRDSAFAKVNTIVRRLCRVDSNRGFVLAELASVAHGLGNDAIEDLRSLRLRMDAAASQHQRQLLETLDQGEAHAVESAKSGGISPISSSVTLSTSTGEMKLLRVLQTLHGLCNDSPDESSSKRNEGNIFVTEELVGLLRQMQFDDLWDELASCLKIVQVLEGVKSIDEEDDDKDSDEIETGDDGSRGETGAKRKLRNSSAGLLTRFLPSIEAFFVANASATRLSDHSKEGTTLHRDDVSVDDLVGGRRVMEFVSANKVILNALVRNNPGLLDKGFRALVQVPRCRVFLDFDVKRQWFKTQVRRLRQHASRRHGSLRLHIRRKFVFEDAYHQLRLRNADEMRGRLHITFRDEEGVDAGGLSREFFGILSKEIFNPNYALFTSTEDGCTFQPNPNSSINPDHLSYFRFVGRIVGKALADGFLLDAHFTRSLYKHMLGLQPTHHDMEAIDPDYYRNLKTILEFNLADIGLDLTFSIEDHSFGRNQVIDLVPSGRKLPVTEENKEEYVRLVCQHRMTAAIQSQIKAYLDGFYELISPDLISIFTPRELELLISGLPDIDMLDLKKNTDYVGWKSTDKEIGWFWNILFSLSRNEKAGFLQFVTGSSKVPLAGFSELQGMRGVQKFSIHKAGGTKGALISAHTCFNSLDLPVYSGEEETREKLLYAINEGVGAFLIA